MAVISFDFDDTLAEEIQTSYNGTALFGIMEYVDLLKEHHALGHTCIILTARSETPINQMEIKNFLNSFDLTYRIDRIVFTNHELKGPFAVAEGVHLHYDDDLDHLRSIRQLPRP